MSKKKKRSFWADGLSINETKFSVLVVMTVIGFGYSIYSHAATGDITNNLLDLVKFLVISIVGINCANYVTEAFRSKRETKGNPPYNDVAGEDNELYQDPNQKY